MRPSRPLKKARLLVLILVLVGAPARGAIEGSPHDLIAQGYDVAKASPLQERCRRCHISTSPAQQDFFRAVPPILEFSYSASSLVCFSCHDGTTIVSPEVDASRTAFHPASHGSDLTGYEGLLGDNDTAGLPFLDGKRMDCVTCHDPHDSGHRPMLRADIGEICLSCHSAQSEFGLADQNATGNHPQGANPATLARNDVPLKVAPAFMTPFPASYPLAGGRASVGTHWDLGGHLSSGGTGTIGCVTCHAVHGDEEAPPRASAGLLAADPVRQEADLFCEGCHTGERGDGQKDPLRPNPGGTTTGRTYHPADNDLSNGAGSIVETRNPEGWPLGAAAGNPILCSTCHRAHGARERTSILRPPPAELGFCEVCHERLPLAYHHPLVEKGAGACADQAALNDPVTGMRRTCDYCHRAHNAGFGAEREKDYVPLLRDSLLSDDLCLRCHPADNPTCGERPEYRASHFLGDPTLSETYQDATPPLRLMPWPGSKLLSVYGGEKGQVMICLSCHAFRSGSVASGDDGKSRFLVARSGNSVEWADDEGAYLCTGCHGEAPGTGAGPKGHTHPLMTARVATLGREPAPPITATPAGHINCDSCHRAHEARTGSGYYILELVESTNKDPKAIHPAINYTSTCYSCHPREKY